MSRPNVRRHSLDWPVAIGWAVALGCTTVVWLALIAAAWPANDGTDTGVDCVDDCLELSADERDTTADREPIRDDQEGTR